MEGVVVVVVVPALHSRRDIAILEGAGQRLDRLDRGLADLRVVAVKFAVGREDILAAIGDIEMVEGKDAIVPDRVHLKAVGVDIARSLRPELCLYRLEEIEERIPGL